MRQLASLVAALALLAGTACESSKSPEPPPAPRPKGGLTYDGATSISNRILPLALPAFEKKSGFTLKVERSGGGKGLKAMFAGFADVAGLSRVLSPEERSRKPTVAIIGYDALGVWVNDQNPIRGLTRDQLKGIFTGKITNWKQLGGKDRAVVACTEHLLSERSTLEAFRQLALDGAPYAGVKELEDPSDCLKLVATDPDAITAATTAYAIAGIRPIAIDGVAPDQQHIRNSTYPLTRPLLLVTREPPVGPLREFIEFMVSPEGQALVAQAGFVAAR
jgi:phosphate transport system substrate-binding protein